MNDEQKARWEQLRDKWAIKRTMRDRMVEGNWHQDASHFAKEMDAIRAEMKALVAEALPITAQHPRFVAPDFEAEEPFVAGHPRNGY